MSKKELIYISDRTNQFRYVDKDGVWQWTQPVSAYKANEPILRGQAVSVVSAEEANSNESDPSPYVRLTDTSKDVKCIGLALETVAAGELVHILPFGRFDFDSRYNGIDNIAEYDPGFTYADVSKKVYVKNGQNGCLTVDEEEILKSYNHIICVGHLTDAPVTGTNQTLTTVEITISGDERGPVDHTQFEGILGEDVYISESDPIRFFAFGQEEDENFSFKLNFTPQGASKTFTNHDFIALQKYDGKTIYLYPGSTLDLNGVEDDSDAAFIRMSNLYAKKSGVNTVDKVKITLNSDYTGEGIDENIDNLIEPLQQAFKTLSGFDSSVTVVHSNADIPYGSLELTSNEPGGYYSMYISAGLLSSFNSSGVSKHGSYNNKGKVVLADIRIPTRRNICGAYIGNKFGELKAGYSTIFLRLGEYTLNPDNLADNVIYKSTDDNDIQGKEFYLGYNGNLTNVPYNQYDYVSKIATLKTHAKLLVDVGNATRHYNGELPVGYMKPSIAVEDELGGYRFYPEYGFFLLDGVSEYPIAEPYLTVYNRLVGHFSEEELRATRTNYFKVPHVTRQNVPMQMKFLSEGIYEDLPRIPFIRNIGRFAAEAENTDTPVTLPEIEITSLIDYGISDEGYTKPGLDNLDIHLYIDPNKNYTEGPHDWREVREGFFNFNTYGTYGFSWTIREDLTIVDNEIPYGRYYLSTNIGDSLGISYVDGNNQAPLRLDNCYYKIYIARREVFQRQFDIDGVFKDYISDSVYNSNGDPESKLAVTGKAVLDAIENKKDISEIIATDGAIIKLGDSEKNVTTQVIELISNDSLPVISKNGQVILGNSLENNEFEKIIIENGKVYKVNANVNDDIYKAVDTIYTVNGDVIPNARQVRAHAEATIDGKDFAQNYADKDHLNGKIHGMKFGMDGNVDASMLSGLKAKFTHSQTLTSSDNSENAYIPIVHKNNNGEYRLNLEGYTVHINSSGQTLLKKGVTELTSDTEHKVLDNYNLSSEDDIYVKSINNSGGSPTFQIAAYPKENMIAFFKGEAPESIDVNSLDTLSYAKIVADEITRGSWSKTKKIYGERFNNPELFTTSLAAGSKQYTDANNPYADVRSKLGSALQAAYELPLAYWRGNGDKDWYKKSLGIVVERVLDVSDNLATTEERDIFSDKYNYTESEIESIQNYFATLTNSVGQDTSSTIGMLLAAAKETQERLLKIETSTFGKDSSTIPGNKKPTISIDISGVDSTPTTYGLNRLVKAICAELYGTVDPNNANTFKIEGNKITSLSRIDSLDRDIHGISNSNGSKANVTAENSLSDISSSTYPYSPTYSRTDNDANEAAGVNVKTLEKFTGTALSTVYPNNFNGTADAIKRITEKLNKLTEEVNGEDNINLGPKVIFTIDDKVKEIIEELYYASDNEIPGDKISRLDELTNDLYSYTLPRRSTVQASNEFATDVVNEDNDKGLIFNGKVANIPLNTSVDSNISDIDSIVDDNAIANYNYASVIDILIDAIGPQWFRKHFSVSPANLADKRLEKTITDRLSSLEEYLDRATYGIDKGISSSGFENYSNSSIVSQMGIKSALETIADLLVGNQTNIEYGSATINQSAENTISRTYTVSNENPETGETMDTSEVYEPSNILAGLRNLVARVQSLENYSALLQEAVGDSIYNVGNLSTSATIGDNGYPTILVGDHSNSISNDIKHLLNTVYGVSTYKSNTDLYYTGNNLVEIAKEIYRVPAKAPALADGSTPYMFSSETPSSQQLFNATTILDSSAGFRSNVSYNRFEAIEQEIFNIRKLLGVNSSYNDELLYGYNLTATANQSTNVVLPNLIYGYNGISPITDSLQDNTWGNFESDNILNELLFVNNAARNIRAVVGPNNKLGTYLDISEMNSDLKGRISVKETGNEDIPTRLGINNMSVGEYNTLRDNTSDTPTKTLIDRITALEKVVVNLHDYIKRNIAGGDNELDAFTFEVGDKLFVPYVKNWYVIGGSDNGLGDKDYEKVISDFISNFKNNPAFNTTKAISEEDTRKVTDIIAIEETIPGENEGEEEVVEHEFRFLEYDPKNTKLDSFGLDGVYYNPVRVAYSENNVDSVITFNGKRYCANFTAGTGFTSYLEERKYQSELLQDIVKYIDKNPNTSNGDSYPTTNSLI